MEITARVRGIDARLVGAPEYTCPYWRGTLERHHWLLGWREADREMARRDGELPDDVTRTVQLFASRPAA